MAGNRWIGEEENEKVPNIATIHRVLLALPSWGLLVGATPDPISAGRHSFSHSTRFVLRSALFPVAIAPRPGDVLLDPNFAQYFSSQSEFLSSRYSLTFLTRRTVTRVGGRCPVTPVGKTVRGSGSRIEQGGDDNNKKTTRIAGRFYSSATRFSRGAQLVVKQLHPQHKESHSGGRH